MSVARTHRALRLARTNASYTRHDRRLVCGGSAAHQRSVRTYNRARRREGRAIVAEALADAAATLRQARIATREAGIETEGPMRIWSVSREATGWEQYTAIVVVAPTADLARRVHPDSDSYGVVFCPVEGRFCDRMGRTVETPDDWGVWTDDIDNLVVTEVGAASPAMAAGTIICKSYTR